MTAMCWPWCSGLDMHYLESEVGTISMFLTGSKRLRCLKFHSKYAKTPAFKLYCRNSLMLSLWWPRFSPRSGELRSCKPHGVEKKKKNYTAHPLRYTSILPSNSHPLQWTMFTAWAEWAVKLPFSICLIQNALYDTAYRLLHTLKRFFMPFSQSLNFKSTLFLSCGTISLSQAPISSTSLNFTERSQFDSSGSPVLNTVLGTKQVVRRQLMKQKHQRYLSLEVHLTKSCGELGGGQI